MQQVLCLVLTLFVLLTGSRAHLSVTPATVTPRDRATFGFSIAHDCGDDTLGTTNFTIGVPQGLYSVKVEQTPNWHVIIHSKNLTTPVTIGSTVYNDTVTAVEFHGFLQDGFYKTFGLKALVGELKVGTKLYWKGYQECHGDGKPIAWDMIPTPGGPEPDYPAAETEVVANDSTGQKH